MLSFMVNRATSYEKWRDALRLFVAPSSNFVFADTEGNIAYQCTGRIPIRVSGGNGTLVLLASQSLCALIYYG